MKRCIVFIFDILFWHEVVFLTFFFFFFTMDYLINENKNQFHPGMQKWDVSELINAFFSSAVEWSRDISWSTPDGPSSTRTIFSKQEAVHLPDPAPAHKPLYFWQQHFCWKTFNWNICRKTSLENIISSCFEFWGKKPNQPNQKSRPKPFIYQCLPQSTPVRSRKWNILCARIF